MKIKGLIFTVVASALMSSVYGADKGKSDWEEYGLFGKVKSLTEETFDQWSYADDGSMNGTVAGDDLFRIEFSKRGKELKMERDFTTGRYAARGKKVIEYDENGDIKHIIKKVKDTPSYELIDYYDSNNKKVKIREVFKTDSTMRVVTRVLDDDSEIIAEYFYDDTHRLISQIFTYPGGTQVERKFDYYKLDEHGNWLEAFVTTSWSTSQTQELRIRTYTYFE